MKRKVVLHGPSSLIVTLPKKWTDSWGIEKGGEVDIEEDGNTLHVYAGSHQDRKTTAIDIGKNHRVGVSFITSLYRSGFDEVDITFEGDFLETLQKTLSNELLGFEVVSQQSNRAKIQDLATGIEEGIETAIRRSWLLILSITKDTYQALINEDWETLKTIKQRDKPINKFANYSARILLKKQRGKWRSAILYNFVKNLEEVGDVVHSLATAAAHRKVTLVPGNKKTFLKLIEYLENIYKNFYELKVEELESLFHGLKDLYKGLEKQMQNGEGDPIVLHYLHNLTERLREMLPPLIELSLNPGHK